MFTLELDLVLAYIPPMIDRGAGICLTREIQLSSCATPHADKPRGN